MASLRSSAICLIVGFIFKGAILLAQRHENVECSTFSDTIYLDGNATTTIVNSTHGNSTPYIVSMNYPNNYPPNSYECWTLTSISDEVPRVKLFVSAFSLEMSNSKQCDDSGDFVQIYNSDHKSGCSFGPYCGLFLDKGTVFVSAGRSLYVQFQSNGDVQKQGFKFNISPTSDGATQCGVPKKIIIIAGVISAFVLIGCIVCYVLIIYYGTRHRRQNVVVLRSAAIPYGQPIATYHAPAPASAYGYPSQVYQASPVYQAPYSQIQQMPQVQPALPAQPAQPAQSAQSAQSAQPSQASPTAATSTTQSYSLPQGYSAQAYPITQSAPASKPTD